MTTPRLVALDVPGDQRFVDALRHVWDRGDAVLPVDQRLPARARRSLLDALAPSSVIGADGEETALTGGRPLEPGDAVVVATSGTTGTPRGVILTHDAVDASADASSRRLGVRSDDHWLACLPLSHVGGLSVVTRALRTGARLTVHPRFEAEAVERAGATMVSLVTTALRRVDPAGFRVILLGGSRPPEDVPDNVVTTYGMTETGSGVVYDGVPLDGVEVRIDPGTDLSAGERESGVGEILVRGPMLLRAYRDGPAELDDGWLRTGDLGRLDAGSRLVVHGRAGDLIISGGENIWPDAVERALATHPDVGDVAVAGRPDLEWGQVVTAFVVPRADVPGLDDLRAHVTDVLPRFAAPRRLVIVQAIPRTSLGKIARHQLPS